MKTEKLLKINQPIRNIYNQEEINIFISNLIHEKGLDTITNKNIIHWITSNFKNYLFREHEVTVLENPELTEEWMKKSSHKSFSLVNLNSQLHSNISHIIDYFISEKPNLDLTRISFHDALIQSIKWTENQKEVFDDLNGRENFIEFDDGYKWVKLSNEQAIDYEGYQMSHCVASNYKKDILTNKVSVYSLRDAKNIPHVTLMINNETNIVQEIKGKSNHVVKPVYQFYLVELLNDLPFYHIKNSEKDFIPNISFNSINHQFVFIDDASHSSLDSNDKVYEHLNFYSHYKIDLKSFNYLSSQYNRPVELFDILKNIESSKFFHVSLNTNNQTIFNNISKINAKNLLIKNNFTNYQGNKFNIQNSFVQNFKIEHNRNKPIVFTLNTPTAKKIEFKVDENKKSHFNAFNKAFRLNQIDLSINDDMDLLYLEDTYVYKLILPTHIKKIIFKNCKIDILDFNNSNIDTFILESTEIPNENIIKANTVIYNNLKLVNEINCNIFISSTLSDKNLNSNIKSIANTFVNDFSKVTDISNFNLSESYFSSKSIYNLIEKFLPSEPDIKLKNLSGSNLKNILSNCFKKEFSDLSKFSKFLYFHEFSQLKYDDINLLVNFNDKKYFDFYYSSNFQALKIEEIVQIITYEILKYSLKDFSTDFFSSLFNQKLSENVLNHISLKLEKNDYATPQILNGNPNFTELCKPKPEKVINEIHEAIYEVLTQYEIFTPYLKNIKFKPKPSFDIDDIFKSNEVFVALDFIKQSLNEKDLSEFTFPTSKFDLLYHHLQFKDQKDLIIKFKEVMKYDFIPDEFREFVIEKFTKISLENHTTKP